MVDLKMIECKDAAYKTFIEKLQKRGLQVKVIANVNKSRHKIIETVKDGIVERYYLIYKRDWYNTFSKEFPKFIKRNPLFYDCVGESINEESLDLALANTCEFLVFCHPEGFYIGYTQGIKNMCIKNDLVRRQEATNKYKDFGGGNKFVNETTYSFPKQILTELK